MRNIVCCVLLLTVAMTASLAAEPVATFQARELLGRNWPETLVTYRVELPAGKARPDAVRLVNAEGKEQPCQLWRVKTHPDGSIAEARISYYASLPAKGAYTYQLLPEKATIPPGDVKISTAGDYLTLENAVTGVRLPKAGIVRFPTPLRFGNDHAAMVKLYGKQVGAGLAPGPLQGFRLAGGQWIGGSYFTTKDNKDAPQVTGYTCTVTEQGPLFGEAIIRYTFNRDGFYQLTVRLLTGDAALELDEQYDLGVTSYTNTNDYVERNYNNNPFYADVPDVPGMLKVVFSLAGTGWHPDLAYATLNGGNFGGPNQGRDMALEGRFTKLGFTVPTVNEKANNWPYLSRVTTTDQPTQRLFHIKDWGGWNPGAGVIGLADTRQFAEGADRARIPFIGIVPVHMGNWRGAQGAFMSSRLSAHAVGDVSLEWPIRVEAYPNSHLDSGEYDPALPFSYGRRQWLLVAGPVRYYPELVALRKARGHISLDDYKDWILEWPEDPNTTYPRLGMNTADIKRVKRQWATHPAVEALKRQLYFQDTPDPDRKKALLGYTSQLRWLTNTALDSLMSGFVRTGLASSFVNMDEWLATKISPDERREIRMLLAAVCYSSTEPDEHPRGSMMFLGNPNMPLNRFFVLPLAASLIPDHPMAKEWMEVSRQEVAYQLAKNTDASGAWSEGIHYQPVGYGPLLHGAYALKVNGMLDDRLARLAAMPSQYMLRLVSPPDPRMAIWERWWQDKEPHGPTRAVQGWGHEQLYSYLHWLEAAAVVRDADPAMARSLTWMWDHVGRPQADSYGMHANHMADFAERVAVHADLVNTIPKGYVPPELNSSWLPSMGATLRAHVGNPDETFLSARMGYFHSHTDPNHGDFVLYAKGAPLVSMSSRVYVVLSTAPEVMALNKEFGWASAVRFGSRDNVGHWAGGVPTAGIYTHLFSDSVDYLRGLGDYDPQQWARQILFLKGKAADGPNYFVFRDSFTPLGSDAKNLQQTFWTIKNPGKKEWVTRTDTGLEFTSSFGPKLNLRFLQPATVASESREAADIHNRGAAEAAPDRHLFTVTSFGPIAAGQDVLAVLYPRQAEEVVPAYTKLADGAARIVTSEGTDFVFLGHGAMQYAGNDISFDGVAGAVRVYPDEVHLVIAEGPSRIMYKGMELRSEIPVCKIIPLKQVKDGKVITNPTPELTPKPALPKLKNPVQLAPGVTRGACTEGIAYTFDSATAISFEQEGVRFVGKQGMLVINENAGTVRCVLRNGTRIGYKGAQIWSAPGPYDITFFPDRIAGRYVGPGRLAFMTMPDGLITQPTYVLDGQTFAVGTDWRTLIVPFMSGEHAFEIRTLAQPAVFRNWQAWE